MSAPDLSPAFYDAWAAMAARLGVDPLALARVSLPIESRHLMTNPANADAIVMVIANGRDAQIVIDTEHARSLSPEADAFFEPLAPFVALMQNDEGAYGFVDADEVAEAGEEPARLGYPREVSQFLEWFGRKFNARRPLEVAVIMPGAHGTRRPSGPMPMRRSGGRQAPLRMTRRGRRDL